MAKSLDPQTVEWIYREAKKLEAAEIYPGSPRETAMLATWQRVRPEMFKRLGRLAPKLAFVLDLKRYQAVKQYLQAGMSPTDAEEQATREWSLLEPEDPESPLPPLFDRTSTLTTQSV